MGQDNDGAVRPPTLFVACAETSCMTDEKRERERNREKAHAFSNFSFLGGACVTSASSISL